MCTSPLFFAGRERGWTFNQILKKGAWQNLISRRGCWESGGDLFQGECNFYIKNILKSERGDVFAHYGHFLQLISSLVQCFNTHHYQKVYVNALQNIWNIEEFKNHNRRMEFHLYLEQIPHDRKVWGITYLKRSSKIHILTLIKKFEIFGYPEFWKISWYHVQWYGSVKPSQCTNF